MDVCAPAWLITVKTMFMRAIILKKLLTLSCVTLFSYTIFINPLYANPQNGVVIAGGATINQSPGLTQINQSTDKAIINWQGFSIDTNEHTHFQQPSSSSITLNRVTGNQASRIMGKLSANGKIMLLNPSGIIFGPNSHVDVAGLIASTANIKDNDFLNGNYHFVQDPNFNKGIVNEGTITVADRGLTALVAPSVQNNGKIVANLGTVALASGTEFTVDLQGDETIQFATGTKVSQATFTPDGQLMKSGVANSGQIYANGGKVVLTAQTAENIVDNAINMDGVIEAKTLAGNKGSIILAGGNEGVTSVSGTLDVSGLNQGETAGTIQVTGKHVHITSTARLKATGDASGGSIVIGGNHKGSGPVPNADTTTIENGSVIDASTITSGNGGDISIWSNQETLFNGALSARGGALRGNGGNAEISSANHLWIGQTVDLSAPNGYAGTLLLDPGVVTIMHNASIATPTSWDTVTDGYINKQLLTNNLVISTYDSTTQGPGNIERMTINGTSATDGAVAISWTGNTSLSLVADQMQFNSGATITHSAGSGNLVLQAGRAANSLDEGTVTFSGQNVNFSGSTGNVSIYYNPTHHNYSSPTNFSSNVNLGSSGATLTAYMLINTVQQLTDISAISTTWNQNLALATDLDLSSISNFSPIGNSTVRFTGKFDGMNHTIDHLTINSNSDDVGLFGYTHNATIANLGLTNVNITGEYNVGGLIGNAYNGNSIDNVYVTGNVSGFNAVGGIIGMLEGEGSPSTLTNSYNAATVNADDGRVGGLVGVLTNASTISNSYNTGAIQGGNEIGGLAGENNGSISNAYNTGTVTSITGGTNNEDGNSAGGITGLNNGTITQSFNTGNINGTIYAGGLVGLAYGGSISSSYNTGHVSGTSDVGGLIGLANPNSGANLTLNNNYNTGYVVGTSSVGGLIGLVNPAIGGSAATISNNYNAGYVVGGDAYTGGLIGSTTTTSGFSNNFWDKQTSGPTNGVGGDSSPSGITGLNTSQMMTQSSFSTWNFSNIWAIIEGNSYPYLQASYTGIPQVISGTIYSDQGLTSSAGQTVAIAKNGVSLTSVMSGANGAYYYLAPNGTFSSGNLLLAYIPSGGSVQGTSVAGATSTNPNITGFDIYGNTVIGWYPSNTLSNSSLITAKGSLSDSGILYTGSGSNISLSNNNNVNFLTRNDTTYTLNGNLTTDDGNINFQGPVNIVGNITINSGTGNITFDTTVNGAGDLTINSSNEVSLNGNIDINSLSLANSLGTTKLGLSNITVTDGLLSNSPILLYHDVTINGGNSNLAFTNIDSDPNSSPHSLTLNASGTTILNGDIDVKSLTLSNSQGTAELALRNINVTTGFSSDSSILLYHDVTINGGNSDLTFTNIDSAPNSSPHSLALNTSGTINLHGGAGWNNALSSLLISNQNGSTILGNTVVTNAGATFNAPVTLNGSIPITVNDTTGNNFFNSSVDLNGHTLTLNGSGTTTFNGQVEGTGSMVQSAGTALFNYDNHDYSWTTTLNDGTLELGVSSGALGSGTVTLNGGTLLANTSASLANQIIVGGDVTLGGDNDLTLSGPITIGTVNAPSVGLDVTNSAHTTLSGIITGTGSLSNSNGTLTVSNSNTYTGSTTLNSGTLQGNAANNPFGTGSLVLKGGTVESLFNGESIFGNNSFIVSGTPTIGGDNDLTLSGPITIGTVNIPSTTLDVTNSAHTTLSGIITGTGSLSNSNGTLTVSNNNTYTGSTILNSGILQAGNDNAFGTGTLTLKGGELQASVSPGVTLPNLIDITNDSTMSGENGLSFTNTVTFADNTTLSLSTPLVDFQGTLQGPGNLVSSASILKLNNISDSDPLNSITTTQASTTYFINNGVINTINDQTYNGAIHLLANSTLTSNNGNLTFGGTIDDAHDLTLNATNGHITFDSNVGNNGSPLTSLTINGLSAYLNGNIIHTSDTQQFNAPIILGANVTLSSNHGFISLKQVNDDALGMHSLSIDNTGITYFTADIGGQVPIYALNTDTGGTSYLGANITTYSHINLNDNVLLTTDTIRLTSLAGNININNKLDGLHNLILTANHGDIYFGNLVGSNTPLTNLIINNAHNVSSAALLQVGNFTQYQGNGTTNLSHGLMASDDISVTNNAIIGTIQGDNIYLNGLNKLALHITAQTLLLDGKNGGELYGSIAGVNTEFAAMLARLATDALGDFVFNGCLIPGGCVAPIINNAATTSISDETNQPYEKKTLACTVAGSAKENGGSDCDNTIAIKPEAIASNLVNSSELKL